MKFTERMTNFLCALIFLLMAASAGAAQTTFSNSAPITIFENGPATLYPSHITVSGLTGAPTKVTVTLTNINHLFPDDLDVLLVSPTGARVMLMSDAGGNPDLSNVTLTFDDAAAGNLPDSTQIGSGTFRPTNFDTTSDAFPAPAPAAPYGTTLADFNGADANGTWSLYIVDDTGLDDSSIAGGWSLSITTAAPAPGQFKFRFSDYTTSESGGTATIAVDRANGFSGAATVDYAISGGTATGGASCAAGIDFVVASGTLAFGDGISSRTFAISICSDTEFFEPDETVNLVLSNPTGSTALSAPSSATLAIIDFSVDGFDPNPNGTVETIVVQPDGKIIIGGTFTTVAPNGGAPVTRFCIARFNSDGTLDQAFNPNANSTVYSIVLTGGAILVGGAFTSIGGQSRSRIARLDAVTGAADSFNPNANSTVRTIAVESGKILVGGSFGTIGGATRNRIARLNGDGTADSFDPNPGSNFLTVVNTIAVQPDGKILVGGNFTNIGGQSRNSVARLDSISGTADSFNPPLFGIVFTIVAQPGGILIGGDFNGDSTTRNDIMRVTPATGAADTSFDPNPNSDGAVYSIAVQSDGKIIVGGIFTNIGNAARNRVARLDPATGAVDSFNPNANNRVNSVVVQPDGKILVGGSFTSIGGAVRKGIARFASSGNSSPTAALVTVGGRVTTTDGRGIRNVRLTLTNAAGETRTVFSSAFGYYRFADVQAGANYILSATGKRFVFEQPTQVLFVSEDLNKVEFVASP